MSETVTVTAKNQITLPRGLRQGLGVKRGDKLIFLKTPDGRYLVAVVKIPEEPAKALEGALEEIQIDAVSLKHSIHKIVAGRMLQKMQPK
jgi:AbrB family looped-hinge helix DNA binding protein